jgi:chromate transporter
MSRSRDLRELAVLFLILGTFGFGGPPAHLAMFEREVVKKRKWLTSEEFLDLIGAANLVPGPNSTEVAFALGLRRAGLAGMLVSGVCFILPAALITGLIASAYVAYGSLPEITPFLMGTKAAVIGIIVGTAALLSLTATKSLALAGLGVLALMASVWGAPEALILIGAGLLALLGARLAKPMAACSMLLSVKAWAFGSGAAAAASVSLGALFLFFLQIGATIYGGGFVLASYLQSGLVDSLGWLTEGQLLDAVTVGQVTPGPVFSTATFVGYVLAGVPGAVVATIAIFLPCVLLVPLLHRLLEWSRERPLAAKFLDGVGVAAVALILSVAIKLGPTSLMTWPAVLLAAGAAIATFMRVNAGVVALSAGALMWLLSL